MIVAMQDRATEEEIQAVVERMMDIGLRLCPFVAGLTLVAGSAFAQTPSATPTPTVPPDSVPGQIAAGQSDCAGPEPERKAEPVGRRHPSERGGPGH